MIQDIAVLDVAVMVIVVVVCVLTGYLVATMIWIRRTAVQSERLLSQVNDALPEILRDIKRTSENVQVVSALARESAEETSVLVHAIGDVGQTVNRMHGVFREKGVTLLTRVARMASGVRAVIDTMKGRRRKEGGNF